MEHMVKRRRAGVLPSRSTGRVMVALAALASATALGLASVPGAVATESSGSANAQSQAATSVYPASDSARDFNKGPAGWRGYQEYSAGCWLRGGTCPKMDTVWMPNGGPKGKGDGFLRFKGNSPAIYGFPYGQGAYTVWQSPLFTYTDASAKSWLFEADWRATHASYAIGWNGMQVEIVDAKNQVVRTAMPAKISVPNNHWSHVKVPFDGGDGTMKVGQQYRISLLAIDYYGPSAATLGHHDWDNVKVTVSDQPGAEPVVKCRRDYVKQQDVVKSMMDGDVGSFCSVTEPAGETLKPASTLVDALAKQPSINSMLTTGQGFFVVVDRAAGHVAAWAVGRENIPSTDPRRIYMYLDGGNVGGAADFAAYFVVSNPEHVMKETFGHPGGLPGAVAGVLEGQLAAATEVLSNPVGEALDVDPAWSVANVMWHISTAMGGGLSKGAKPILLPDLGKLLPGKGLPQLPVLPKLPGKDLPQLPGKDLPQLPVVPKK